MSTEEKLNQIIELLTKTDMEKTGVFVRQIEKLSSRLDEAHAENIRLIELLSKQQEMYNRLQNSYDRLYNLAETTLSHINIVNNTSNN